MTRLSIFIGVIILTFKILCSNVFAGPTFVDEYDVSTDETTPTGVIFNPDGTRMYLLVLIMTEYDNTFKCSF